MLLFLFSKLITQTAGFLYPAYLSYKALKARDARALVHCLQYWAVLGIFSCFELLTDLFLFWLPFYYELKLLFVLWLILPFTNGATVIYRTLLHPTLERHEKDIDIALQQVQISAKHTSSEWGRRGFHAIQKAAVDSITAGLSNGKTETHLSVLSSGGEQMSQHVGSLFTSAANVLAIPSARIREVLSSDEEELSSRREGGASMLSGMLPALSLGATSHGGDHVNAISGLSREEQYIQSQRAALNKMMDQLNRAEAEVKRNQRQMAPATAPAPTVKPSLPSISASDSGAVSASSSVDPFTEPNSIPRRRSRRHALEDVDNKSHQPHQPHPPRTTRPPHRQVKSKSERSSKATVTATSSSFPSTKESDSDGLVFIDEDLSFTDRELDEFVAGVPATSTPNPRPVPNSSDTPTAGQPDATNSSWFPSLW